MKSYKLFIISLIAVLLLFTGCRTRRDAMSRMSVKPATPCQILSQCQESQPAFATMNISKMSMSLSYGDYAFSFKSSVRVATDSLISISIQPALGIEMLRLELTPTHFTVYDKLNRRYSTNEYEYIRLKWGVDIDYKVFEALFSHHVFTLQSTEPGDFCRDFRVVAPADTTTLLSRPSPLGISHRFDVSMADHRVALSALEHSDRTLLSISYGDMRRFDNILFPVTVDIRSAITEPAVTAQIKIDKVTFDKPLTASRINLSRYTKVGLSDIFHL